jgi:hypothetical protein
MIAHESTSRFACEVAGSRSRALAAAPQTFGQPVYVMHPNAGIAADHLGRSSHTGKETILFEDCPLTNLAMKS